MCGSGVGDSRWTNVVKKTRIHEAGGTTLHSPVSARFLEFFKILVEEGVDLKVVDNDNPTPVMRARQRAKMMS